MNVDINASGLGKASIDNSLLGLIFGYQLHENFSIEARGYGNASDDELAGNTISVDNHFSVIARGIFPVHRNFRPYAMLGYGKSKLDVNGLSESDDVIYGLGVAVSNGNRVQLEIEWMKIYDESFGISENTRVNLDSDTFNINLVYHFPRLILTMRTEP